MPPLHYFFDDATRVALFLGMLAALLATVIAGLNWYAKADIAWNADVKIASDKAVADAEAADRKAVQDANLAKQAAENATAAAAEKADSDKASEGRRRQRVLDDLRKNYIFSAEGMSADPKDWLRPWPPALWLNAQLAAMGENWTVSTDGSDIHWSPIGS